MTEAKARLLVYGRSNGVCERCDRARGQEWQHRKNRSQGGLWTPENGLHLCSPCHRYVTVNPAESKIHGWTVPRDEEPLAVSVSLARFARRMFLTPDGDYSEELVCA